MDKVVIMKQKEKIKEQEDEIKQLKYELEQIRDKKKKHISESVFDSLNI